MCGRYFYSPSDLRRELPGLLLQAEREVLSGDGARDICPGSDAPVIVGDNGGYALEDMRWGFEVAGGMVINARSETIGEKPMFKPLSAGQRCAIPASGYYEWRRRDRQKYTVTLREKPLFFMAGLYRIGVKGREFVILTQPPVSAITPIHNRMPLLLDSREALRSWLGGAMPQFGASEALSIATEGPEQLQMAFL